jgi:hypothetical protein
MLIRAVIKYFRKRIGRIREELRPRDHEEEEILFELFTKRNYVPHSKTEVFRSFNTEYREWIFSLPGFCRAFNIYYGKMRSSDMKFFKIGEVRRLLSSYSRNYYLAIYRYRIFIRSFGCPYFQFTKSLMINVRDASYRTNARIHGYPSCPSLR